MTLNFEGETSLLVTTTIFFGGGKKLRRSPAAERGVGSSTLLPHASGAYR
jgi:hypothetical protein